MQPWNHWVATCANSGFAQWLGVGFFLRKKCCQPKLGLCLESSVLNHKPLRKATEPKTRNPFYGKLLRSSSSRPFPRLCVPSVALNPISLTNADCVHHAFEEIGLIKKSFPFSEINFPKIIFFYELRQAPPLAAMQNKPS